MNMLEAVCPNGHRLQVPLEHAGMKLRCPAPGCGVIFQLSAAAPNGGTVAVGPGASSPGLPQTAPAPQPPAPPPPPPPATAAAPQPQSSQTYANVPLSSAPTTTPGDGGRWAGTEPAPAPAPATASQSGPQVSAPQVSAAPRTGRSFDLSGGALLGAAQAILMLGLVLVLAARGCDSLGARNVVRLKAKQMQEEQTFRAKQAEEIAAEPDATKHAKLRESHDKQRTAQEKSWTAMRNAVDDAASANLIWGYWREMMFVVGTILLSLGLTAVAFVGQGIERYLSFGLLAIIVFSIYIGGAAWFMSLAGSLQGLVPGR